MLTEMNFPANVSSRTAIPKFVEIRRVFCGKNMLRTNTILPQCIQCM